MKIEQSDWIKKAEFVGYSTFTEFSETIRKLPVNEKDIKGDVLVGGQGQAFPERILVCTVESEFQLLRSEIHSLTCCDSSFCTNPEVHLESPVEVIFPNQKLVLVDGSVKHTSFSLQWFLPSIPANTFDTILFFRISSLQNQLENNLITIIKRVLKPGGVFMGSGSFNSDNDNVKKLLEKEFRIEAIEKLPNPDYSGFPYNKHFGFVLRK